MKYFLILLIGLPGIAKAHCPVEVSSEGKTFCLDLTWDFGERKIKGEFLATETLTPHLIPMGEIPQKWVYSKAYISAWEKGDPSHLPVEIPDFRIFPYMQMENGHHHSAGYEFFYDPAEQAYIFRRVAFQKMRGCWSLRWTNEEQDLKDSSHWLLNVTDFKNLNTDQLEQQSAFCETLGDKNNTEGGHHHGHH